MNGRIDSGLGQIVIDTDVIATYAGSVAVMPVWHLVLPCREVFPTLQVVC